jgi:hypothetical protein
MVLVGPFWPLVGARIGAVLEFSDSLSRQLVNKGIPPQLLLYARLRDED